MPALNNLRFAAAGLAMAGLVLSGCSSPSFVNQPDKPPAAETAPSETPTPTPTSTLSPNAMLDQTVTIQDAEGYTVSLAIDLKLGDWVTSVANSLPGQARATSTLEGSIVMTNTTAGRNTNPVFRAIPALSYPAGSPACALVSAAGPIGYDISPTTTDGRYCLIYITWLSGVAQLSAGERATLLPWAQTPWPGSTSIDAAEGDLPAIIETLEQPSGMFLYVENIGSSWGAPPLVCGLSVGSFGGHVLSVVAASPGFECIS